MLAPLPIRERPAPPVGPGAQVVVLGMHRSGTSALTGLLRLLGLWAGGEDDFPPADNHNLAGYWEHRGVWSVDEEILRALDASWSEIADLDLSRLGKRSLVRFRERACEIVRDLDRQGPWVVKDPRLCLLFPFWRELLEHPLCVLIYREPLPVARSLAARDGIPIPYGIALWEQYTREALASTQGLPRELISHRELMADPEAVLRRLHRHLLRLDCPVPLHLRLPSLDEIRGVVNPVLVHHPAESDTERSYLTPPQLDLLAALANGTALDLNPVPPLSPGARDLLAAYQSLPATKRDLHHAHSWLDELDAIFSAILDSRSWKIGNTITAAIGRLVGRSQTRAPERRDQLMAEVRRWRRTGAGK
ncbi:MAG TPA: sulfotransferase [Thermoanaerobaculia bacterium]|nr:sulfotransferase [Thermoanaerobaculia bacterium]